jgi:hypothetical protein
MLRKALWGTAALVAGAAFLVSGPAMAGGNVNWSVNVGVPLYSPPVVWAPQPVYAAPPPVYAPPQPVYFQPQPAYQPVYPAYVSGFVPYGQVVYYDAWRRPFFMEQGRPVYVRYGHGHHPHGHH